MCRWWELYHQISGWLENWANSHFHPCLIFSSQGTSIDYFPNLMAEQLKSNVRIPFYPLLATALSTTSLPWLSNIKPRTETDLYLVGVSCFRCRYQNIDTDQRNIKNLNCASDHDFWNYFQQCYLLFINMCLAKETTL